MSVSLNLCQTGKGSCGACCGLFNFRDHSREAISAELRRHTRELHGTQRTREAFAQKAREIKAGAPPALFPLVRVCPLLGFLDEGETRVGCLAHPAVIGADLRDCGVYTADICETFTCPSYIWLDDDTAALIRDACPDWYTYGLVVTDVEFVRGVMSLLVDAMVRPISARELRERALPEMASLFSLKAVAPDRPRDARVFGRFEDVGTEDPGLRIIDTDQLGVSPAKEDLVVLCLGYAPTTAEQLHRARALVAEHVAAAAAKLAIAA